MDSDLDVETFFEPGIHVPLIGPANTSFFQSATESAAFGIYELFSDWRQIAEEKFDWLPGCSLVAASPPEWSIFRTCQTRGKCSLPHPFCDIGYTIETGLTHERHYSFALRRWTYGGMFQTCTFALKGLSWLQNPPEFLTKSCRVLFNANRSEDVRNDVEQLQRYFGDSILWRLEIETSIEGNPLAVSLQPSDPNVWILVRSHHWNGISFDLLRRDPIS